MNVLLLNGSPRKGRSNTLRVSEAFIKGLQEVSPHNLERVDLCDTEIRSCLGCFRCWTATPGRCVHEDDMAGLLESYVKADLVIWSVPLYYYGLPSQTKAFMDRLLPLNQPQLVEMGEGRCGHPPRYDLDGQRHLLISSCGFFTVENNYEALCRQFSIVYGDKVQWLRRNQGELLNQPALAYKIVPYLDQVTAAGREWMEMGRLSDGVLAALEAPFFSPEDYMTMANASWEIAQEKAAASSSPSKQGGEGTSSDQPDAGGALLRQMAVLYNPEALEGRSAVLEMVFTDRGRRYQMHMDEKGCVVVADPEAFSPHSTRIETPLSVWQRISSGEISGSQAMMEGQYRTTGDFSLMLKMDRLFGGSQTATPSDHGEERNAKTNMLNLLLPWILLWSVSEFSALLGASLTLLCCTALPMLSRVRGQKLTSYDGLSLFLAASMALGLVWGAPTRWIIPLAYWINGLLWLLSLLGKLPITAYYSAHDYGGETMFENPLFLRTNAILTAAWAGVYLFEGAANFLLASTFLADYSALLLLPVMLSMLLFTHWFQRWYPARVARGR